MSMAAQRQKLYFLMSMTTAMVAVFLTSVSGQDDAADYYRARMLRHRFFMPGMEEFMFPHVFQKVAGLEWLQNPDNLAFLQERCRKWGDEEHKSGNSNRKKLDDDYKTGEMVAMCQNILKEEPTYLPKEQLLQFMEFYVKRLPLAERQDEVKAWEKVIEVMQ